MKYGRCTDDELDKFCTARGVVVEPIPAHASHRQERQHRKDRITALEHADANPGPFRFLNLSAELRTAVYENLLVFENSFSCYPQILVSSKAVNEEASNILYGDNLIEVKVWPDGIYAHGMLSKGKWAEFLRKVQFTRVSYGSQASIDYRSHERPAYFEWTLSALCEFLMGKHKLRSMKVSFVRAPPAVGLPIYDSPFDTYALRMLGTLKECVLEGVDGVLIDYKDEVQMPLRLIGPFENGDALWQTFYEDCLQKWDEFLVKCHQLNPLRDLRGFASQDVARHIQVDVEEALGKVVWLGHIREPDIMGESYRNRVKVKYDTRQQARNAFNGGFLAFVNDLGPLVVRRRVTRDFPAFLGEFEKFCIDAKIARHLSKEWE